MERRCPTLAVVLLFCLSLWSAASAPSTKCKIKEHNHKAIQTDLTGKKCWDHVKIQSCGGFCLSYEISHWQFPYKESHHPVCVHDGRRHKRVELRYCDPGVEPGTQIYHYVEAESCKCQICSSEDTSCEWLPPDNSLLGGIMLNEDVENDIDD